MLFRSAGLSLEKWTVETCLSIKRLVALWERHPGPIRIPDGEHSELQLMNVWSTAEYVVCNVMHLLLTLLPRSKHSYICIPRTCRKSKYSGYNRSTPIPSLHDFKVSNLGLSSKYTATDEHVSEPPNFQQHLRSRTLLPHRRVGNPRRVPGNGLVCQLELENGQQDRKHNLCN